MAASARTLRRLGLVALAAAASMLVWRSMPFDAPTPPTDERAGRHLRATYDPMHFKPAILAATDAQCLACHREVLDDRVRAASPAGVPATKATAGYQRVSTYAGEQETFHRRHLATPLATKLMRLRCNTCHEGHDPREEAPGSSATAASQEDRGFTLRKQVNPETACLKCHGQMRWRVMKGLDGPWREFGREYRHDCLACHSRIRTVRHRVNYLNAEAIEAAGERDSEVCYGCHGGRAWYRIAYAYPRHPWPGMPPETPPWARTRPTQSEERFRE